MLASGRPSLPSCLPIVHGMRMGMLYTTGLVDNICHRHCVQVRSCNIAVRPFHRDSGHVIHQHTTRPVAGGCPGRHVLLLMTGCPIYHCMLCRPCCRRTL